MPADADAKTEPATPRRRRDARKKGQIARSNDLSGAVTLFVAMVALKFLGPGMWQSFIAICRASLAPESPTSISSIMPLAGAITIEVAKNLAPFLLIIMVAVFAVLYAQVGNLITFQTITPSLSKINPLNGIKRLFSIRTLMMAVGNLGKLFVVSLVAYLMFANAAAAVIYSFTLGFRDAFWLGAALAFELGMQLSVALLVLALLDYAWQRYKHERDIRMTKEEVKDELRNMEGDPKIKQRRRQLQFQLALQRVRKDVPKADVIVTNPTHLAIAIKYDADSMSAPKVVAKGADQIALRIRQIAMEHSIPIVERKTLARAMYETVEVGQFVPERFFHAIAEILAYVYELTGRSPIARQAALAGAGA